MFGDPLHLLALFSGGSPFWWISNICWPNSFSRRLGFCVGSSPKIFPRPSSSQPHRRLSVLRLRYSHPAFFSLCYAPGVLHVLVQIARQPESPVGRDLVGIMVLANWILLNTHRKEAYILLLASTAAAAYAALAVTSSARPGKIARGC